MAVAEQTVTVTGVQAEFLVSTARYPAYIGARGSGKSAASVLKMVKYVNEHPGQGGALGMFTVPRLGDINDILLPRMRRFWHTSEGKDWVWQEKKSRIVFPTLGWEVAVRPASEPDSCRGPDLAFAAMDEIGTEDQEETFRILQASVRLPGYPLQLWVTTTPNVKRRWIKQRWVDHVRPIDGRPLPNAHQYVMFNATIHDNPHLDPEYKAELLAEYEGTRWEAQELLGKFITLEGLAFPDLSSEIHMKDPPDSTEWNGQITGWDYGASSPTSLHTIKRDTSNRLWITDEFYKAGATEDEWMEWLGEHGVSRIVCDPTGVSESTRLRLQQEYGISIVRGKIKEFVPRAQFWSTGLAVKPGFGPRIYISPKCPRLWEELENAAYDKNGTKWAPGTSDHAIDSGAYGGMFFTGRATQTPVVRLTYGDGWRVPGLDYR